MTASAGTRKRYPSEADQLRYQQDNDDILALQTTKGLGKRSKRDENGKVNLLIPPLLLTMPSVSTNKAYYENHPSTKTFDSSVLTNRRPPAPKNGERRHTKNDSECSERQGSTTCMKIVRVNDYGG